MASGATVAHLDEGLETVRPIRVWIREFSNAEVRRLARAIELLDVEDQDHLPVFINSYGGNVIDLFAMIDLFGACPVPVATIALGTAMSAACDLLAAGTHGYRYVSPNAVVMVHDSASEVSGKIADLKVEAKQAELERDRSFALFAKHTGRTRAFWDKYLAKRQNTNAYLTAAETLALGIADKIAVPTLSSASKVNLNEYEAPARPRRKAKR